MLVLLRPLIRTQVAMMDFLKNLFNHKRTDPYILWFRQRQDLILEENKYSVWREILSNGNAEELQEYLSTISSEAEQYHLVNGIFEEDDKIKKWSSREHKKFAVITPLAMVMSCASISMMECLLQHGANVSSQDPYGHNPVHLIICFSFIKPQLNHI